jgi:hypothetical protein
MTRRNFALSLTAGALHADSGGQARGREIIEKAIQSLGGNAFRNMRTRTETGRAYTFYHNRLSSMSVARFHTKYLLPPFDDGASKNAKVHQLQRQFYGKKQDDSVLYTASGAYELTFRGARPLSEDRVQQYRDATLQDIFYILRQRIDEPGMEFEARGKDVVENQTVETVDIYDAEDRNVTAWFNAHSFLPVKHRFYHWDPTVNERREDVTRYTKFREVSGVMWPQTTERERDSEKNFQLDADKVTINDELSAGFFELPAGATVLK